MTCFVLDRVVPVVASVPPKSPEAPRTMLVVGALLSGLKTDDEVKVILEYERQLVLFMGQVMGAGPEVGTRSVMAALILQAAPSLRVLVKLSCPRSAALG